VELLSRLVDLDGHASKLGVDKGLESILGGGSKSGKGQAKEREKGATHGGDATSGAVGHYNENVLTHVVYSDILDSVQPGDLKGFFDEWPDPPSPETHLRLLQGSSEVMLARHGTQVVGFITANTDGVLSAYIPFLEVLPEYRRQGIGRELVKRMLAKLEGYYMIDLTCDPELRPFYTELGMRALTAMSLRNYAAQSGRP
jgi:GNAT superfamily N-acetyltransferase